MIPKKKKKIQNGQLKKLSFSNPPILNIFLPKFLALFLGLKQFKKCGSTYMVSGQFTAKNAFLMFLAVNWHYFGQ